MIVYGTLAIGNGEAMWTDDDWGNIAMLAAFPVANFKAAQRGDIPVRLEHRSRIGTVIHLERNADVEPGPRIHAVCDVDLDRADDDDVDTGPYYFSGSYANYGYELIHDDVEIREISLTTRPALIGLPPVTFKAEPLNRWSNPKEPLLRHAVTELEMHPHRRRAPFNIDAPALTDDRSENRRQGSRDLSHPIGVHAYKPVDDYRDPGGPLIIRPAQITKVGGRRIRGTTPADHQGDLVEMHRGGLLTRGAHR